MSSNLYHHGTKHQKWGLRRWQNPDGSLTPAGRERYRKLKAKSDKIEAKKQKMFSKEVSEQKKTPNPHGKKKIHDMSDEELEREISRLKLEKTYKDYMKDLYPAKKKKEALIDGRKLVGDILTGSLKTVGTSVATNVLGNQMNRLGKHLGLDYAFYKPEKSDKSDNLINDVIRNASKNKNKDENKNKNKDENKNRKK